MKLSFILLSGGVAAFTALCDICGPTSTAAAQPAGGAGAAQAALGGTAVSPAGLVAATDTVTLRVAGMTCAGCTIATRKVLERLDGVASADVSYERGTAVVVYDPARVTTARMIAAVATLKYTATVVR